VAGQLTFAPNAKVKEDKSSFQLSILQVKSRYMIILLYGQDVYRSRQKLNEIIKEYQKTKKTGLSLKYFEGKDFSFRDLAEDLQQTSIFKEKKLLVIKNPCSNKEFKEEFLKEAESFVKSEEIIILYQEDKLPKNDRLLTFVKKQGKVQEFNLLTGEKLKDWYKKELANYKAAITSEALAKLVESAGNDLWRGSLETKKLVNYKKDKRIEVEDVELLIKPKIEADIFRTIDAIGQKNRRKAISLIHEHLEKGDHPLYLLSMINYQFRNLLIVKELMEKNRPYYAILRESHLHPFVVRKTFQQAKQFSFPELKKIYQKIFQADLSIKTGKMEAIAALDLFLADI